MIRLRTAAGIEELDLDGLLQRAKRGVIAPHDEVCFSPVTGDRFVPARELEFLEGMYGAGRIRFWRYFHLGRVPWLTLAVIAVMLAVYFFWQGPGPHRPDALLRQGAKSRALILELGQWWRLLAANFLHMGVWHLGVNAVFLLNLGGPAESIFRRADFGLLLMASALGAMGLSALLTREVSSGASGMVFGVWGAVAVFGLRYRTILPRRYKRYFIGSVIPYALFALYVASARTGVDNWAHLGGLVAGSVSALLLPPRLIAQPGRPLSKALMVVGLATGLALMQFAPMGPGTLVATRVDGGLSVAVPARWEQTVARRDALAESYTFENDAGVALAFEVERLPSALALDAITQRFMAGPLAAQLRTLDVRRVDVQDAVPAVVGAAHAARRIRARLELPRGLTEVQFLLFGRREYAYTLSLTAPMWLLPAYRQIFDRIVGGVVLVEAAQ